MIDARRHGRVRREDVGRGGPLPRLGIGQAAERHEQPDLLQPDERGVPLVDVPDRRTQPQQLQRAQPADAEHDLLADAGLLVAAVEPRGDVAVGRVVLREVRVQQEQRDPSHAHEPDEDGDLALADRQLDDRRASARNGRQRDRKPRGVERRVALVLPPVGVEGLAEVVLAVEEADPDDRKPPVARGLEDVAGEDAEAPGVDGKVLGQAELGREVRDPVVALAEGAHRGVPGRRGVLDRELRLDGGKLRQEDRVRGRLLEAFLRRPSAGARRDFRRTPPTRRGRARRRGPASWAARTSEDPARGSRAEPAARGAVDECFRWIGSSAPNDNRSDAGCVMRDCRIPDRHPYLGSCFISDLGSRISYPLS